MKNQLVEKLRRAISEDISKECQVVYILAEARKLLEKYPPSPIPFALKMYCHWALHVDLTVPRTTDAFLQRVDEFVKSFLAGSSDVNVELRMFCEFSLLETFRTQFLEFLKAHDLPTSLCDEDNRWHDFLRYYARVIEDGSLCCQANIQRLKYVEKVTVERAGSRPSSDSSTLDLSWRIALLDRRSLTVDVYKTDLPNGTPILCHSIKLDWKGYEGLFPKSPAR